TPGSICIILSLFDRRRDRFAFGRRRGGAGRRDLPSAHTICYALVEIAATDHSFYASEAHALAHLVADPGEGQGDALTLEFLGEAQQLVAGAGVDEVHRLCIQKHMLCRWAARG